MPNYETTCPVCFQIEDFTNRREAHIRERALFKRSVIVADKVRPVTRFSNAEKDLIYSVFAYLFAGELGGTPLYGRRITVAKRIMEKLENE